MANLRQRCRIGGLLEASQVEGESDADFAARFRQMVEQRGGPWLPPPPKRYTRREVPRGAPPGERIKAWVEDAAEAICQASFHELAQRAAVEMTAIRTAYEEFSDVRWVWYGLLAAARASDGLAELGFSRIIAFGAGGIGRGLLVDPRTQPRDPGHQ